MQMTAVVINSGLGDLSIGLEMAGFKVIASYEADRKAAAVHRSNLDAPVYPLPFEEESIKAVPRADLLAGRLYQLSPSHTKFTIHEDLKATVKDFLTLLDSCRPRVFFLVFNISFLKSEQLHAFLNEAAAREYQCKYQILDVARVAGAPVKERMAYMVGTGPEVRSEPELLEDSFPSPLPPEDFLQFKEPINPWYFNITIDPENIPAYQDRNRFYCWKSHSYVGTELLWWNYWKIPLVNTEGKLRKITHREIANLKGFPESYVLPDLTNRSWLYQKLMFAANVQAIKQIANKIFCGLTKPPWQEHSIPRWKQFEDLFARYLARLENITNIERTLLSRDLGYDFELQMKNQTLYFELKCYSERRVPASRIRMTCIRLSILLKSGKPILVFANEVPKYIKDQCWEQFQVSIWDVQNLLWQFQKFEDLKNEFIALLDYSVNDIVPLPPNTDVFQEPLDKALTIPQAPDPGMHQEAAPEAVPKADTVMVSEVKRKPLDWEERLRHIKPGQEQFQEYEKFCVDILKFALGSYLTLWEGQEQTDGGLHRFDLCCKIKNGVHQDFFDSIKHYFNTKYVVFEFKNHNDKISQKEIYTTEKYLYGTALRKVAIIISRNGYDDNALRAAKGSLRESGKLILCLTDQDLLKMADIKTRGEEEPADSLGEMLDALLIHLEK